MAPRPCSRIDGGVVGVARKGVVSADVGLIGNNPWKLLMKLAFPRSIPEILFCLHQVVVVIFGVVCGDAQPVRVMNILSFITPMSWP